MKSAEEIIKSTFKNMGYRFDGLMQGNVNANDVRTAMKKYATDIIKECAAICKEHRDSGCFDGEGAEANILNLIKELK